MREGAKPSKLDSFAPKQNMRVLKAITGCIDRFTDWTGRIIAWLIIPLVGITVYDVFLRYFLRAPTKWAYETMWMLYAALFILGGAYCLVKKGHISVDIFYKRLSPRAKAIYQSAIYLLLFFPLVFVLVWKGVGWAMHSWAIGEKSYLSYWRPPLYPIKSVLPVAFFLFGLQGVSEFIRNLVFAITGREL